MFFRRACGGDWGWHFPMKHDCSVLQCSWGRLLLRVRIRVDTVWFVRAKAANPAARTLSRRSGGAQVLKFDLEIVSNAAPAPWPAAARSGQAHRWKSKPFKTAPDRFHKGHIPEIFKLILHTSSFYRLHVYGLTRPCVVIASHASNHVSTLTANWYLSLTKMRWDH